MQNKNNNKTGFIHQNFPKKISGGFTIIETMIAISLFLIIVTIGMGSLLNSTLINKKSQDMRSVMDNLSFIMEDISRNLRTGSNYHCIDNGVVTETNSHSCAKGTGISFKSSSGNQWVYAIYPDGTIQKSTNGGISFIPLSSSEINIDTTSGFVVTGAEAGDNLQPFVTIKLIGTITSKNNVVTPFSLQTSVSQRLPDI